MSVCSKVRDGFEGLRLLVSEYISTIRIVNFKNRLTLPSLNDIRSVGHYFAKRMFLLC